jgi:hypothetical protein
LLGSIVVAHTSNPSYLGGRDQEDSGLRPAQGKKLVRLHLNKWLGLVGCAFHLCYAGSLNRCVVV